MGGGQTGFWSARRSTLARTVANLEQHCGYRPSHHFSHPSVGEEKPPLPFGPLVLRARKPRIDLRLPMDRVSPTLIQGGTNPHPVHKCEARLFLTGVSVHSGWVMKDRAPYKTKSMRITGKLSVELNTHFLSDTISRVFLTDLLGGWSVVSKNVYDKLGRK